MKKRFWGIILAVVMALALLPATALAAESHRLDGAELGKLQFGNRQILSNQRRHHE